jgi:hypothetical protein
MLRTNLSTRPFYNTRGARATLGIAGLAVAAMTVLNIVQFARLTSSERALGSRAAEAEAEATQLRDDARRIRAQTDPRELRDVSEAAAEANALIELRTFSWSGLFARFERTLPEDVRLIRFQPRVEDDGRFVVGTQVETRRVEALETFMEALEGTGAFRDVLTAEEQLMPGGFITATLEGTYVPGAEGE